MLHNISDLKGYSISATDGEIGQVEDFYFDDDKWVIRYLVIDTGKWLPGRKVLISPISLGAADESAHSIQVRLNKRQIENSPSIDVDKPVSRQYETSYYDYYGYPYYWGGPFLWGPVAFPGGMAAPPANDVAMEAHQRELDESHDPHLHSAREVTGYYIEANDGDIGHVEDFIVDDQDWAIRYVLVDTKNWWPGKKVVVAPNWIERVSWSDSRVYVNESRDNIQHAPEYESNEALTRDYESRLHDHYHRAPYWD
jgi:sporulation protein YlmC with PRC-barrel domain